MTPPYHDLAELDALKDLIRALVADDVSDTDKYLPMDYPDSPALTPEQTALVQKVLDER